MEKNEIRDFFRLAAEIRHMSPCDLRRKAAEDRLAEMQCAYEAEFIDGADLIGKEPDTSQDWKTALTYVAQLFQSMDGVEQEPDHAMQSAMRRAVWKIVSEAVMEKYADKANSPAPD